MAAVPEGDNVYDVQGTVLYRVISTKDHQAETYQGLATATGAANAVVAAKSSGAASVGVTLLSSENKSQKLQTPLPARLAPLGGATVVPAASTIVAAGGGATPAATTSAASGGGADDAVKAALLMLDNLFPPKRLDDEGGELSSEEEAEGKAGGGSGVDMGSGAALAHSSSQRRSRSLESQPSEGAGACPHWLKVAAVDHTSRLDVVLLQQHLEHRCVEEHARPRGTLCPIRERIFNDGLREITRQVTVLCPERGQLLQELCDGMDQATGTYDVLFDSACQYSVRKSTERDLKAHLFDEKQKLESEVRRCENRVHELRAKYAGMKKRFEEQKSAMEKVHDAEINYVKVSNQQILSEIKRIMSSLETTSK